MPAIPAVAYFRMSSEHQDKSIPQQQEWAQAKAKVEGVEIVTEFKDEAVSGDKTKKRADFHAMLAFCQQRAKERHPVAAIICFSPSRFSRADSHETAAFIWQFREAGVSRILTAERWFDWTKPEDRVMFNLGQDMTEHRYLIDLSRNVTRGKIRCAQAGYFMGGSAPLGYDRVLIDQAGQHMQRLQRRQGYSRPEGWNIILAPSVNQESIETVRWLFREFTTRDVGFRGLATTLNARGIPAPNGGQWGGLTIRAIIENPVYVGDSRWGKHASGRYHRNVNGQLVAGRAGKSVNSEITVLRDTHEPIIDRATFDLAQQRLAANRREQNFPRHGGYVLTGLVYCAHCKRRMQGDSGTRTAYGKTYTYRRYVCSGAVRVGLACKHYAIREDKLLAVLVKKIQEIYLAPKNLEALRRKLREKLAKRQAGAPDESERLRERLTDLEKTIVQGRRRALQAKDDASFAEYNTQIAEWVEQKERLARHLAALNRSKDDDPKEIAATVDKAIGKLHDLRDAIKDAKRESLKELLRQMVSRIVLEFDEVPKAMRSRYLLRKGVVKLRPTLEVAHLSECAKSSPSPFPDPDKLPEIVFGLADLLAV